MSFLLKTRRQPAERRTPSSEEQVHKITEIRGLLGSLTEEMPCFLSDTTIRRFLRARKWSTLQAAKALKETVKWRRQYKPEKICWEAISEKENEAKRQYIADYLDKNGRSVLISKPTIKARVSATEQIKYLVYTLEYLATNSAADGQEEHVTWMFDFRGWAISNTPLSLTRESMHIVQNYYPGMIAVAIFSNTPRIFESFWKIAKHFLEPELKEKAKFVYTNNPESHSILSEMFDMDKLESAFGGRNTASFDVGNYADKMRREDQIRGALNVQIDTNVLVPDHV